MIYNQILVRFGDLTLKGKNQKVFLKALYKLMDKKMEGLNVEIAQRIIDFISGSVYAMNGNLQKISNFIFLATPNGVDISGDIQNLMDAFGSNDAGFTF